VHCFVIIKEVQKELLNSLSHDMSWSFVPKAGLSAFSLTALLAVFRYELLYLSLSLALFSMKRQTKENKITTFATMTS
jgi:hypothetical protein